MMNSPHIQLSGASASVGAWEKTYPAKITSCFASFHFKLWTYWEKTYPVVLLFSGFLFKLWTYFPSSSPASSCHPSVALLTFKWSFSIRECRDAYGKYQQRWNRSAKTEGFQVSRWHLPNLSECRIFSDSSIWQNISDRQKTFGTHWWKNLRTSTLLWWIWSCCWRKPSSWRIPLRCSDTGHFKEAHMD